MNKKDIFLFIFSEIMLIRNKKDLIEVYKLFSDLIIKKVNK